MPGPSEAQKPFTLLVLTRWPSSAGDEQRDERPAAVVDAAPADLERAVPLLAAGEDEAAAAADAGVVEHEVHVVGVVLGDHLVAEALHVGLDADVAAVGGDARAGGRVLPRLPSGLLEVVEVDVAGGHRAALGRQLDHQLAPHPGAATRDDRQLVLERLHRLPPPVVPERSVQVRVDGSVAELVRRVVLSHERLEVNQSGVARRHFLRRIREQLAPVWPGLQVPRAGSRPRTWPPPHRGVASR